MVMALSYDITVWESGASDVYLLKNNETNFCLCVNDRDGDQTLGPILKKFHTQIISAQILVEFVFIGKSALTA